MLCAETRERSGRHANAAAHARPPAPRGQGLDRGMARRTSREDVVWFRKYDGDPEWK
jgi:acyl dehydratase